MPSKFVGLVLEFSRAHPALTAANFGLALLLAPIGDVLLPHLYGRLVSAVERSGHSAAWTPTICVIAALAAWQTGFLAKDLLDMHTQPMIIDFVRTRMVTALIAMHDGEFAEQPKIGQLVSKLVRSPELVSWWTSASLDYLIPYVMSLAVVTAYFWSHDRWLAGSLVLFILAVCLLLAIAPQRCVVDSVERESALQDVDERADDVIRNLASVYGSDTVADEVAGVSSRGEAYRRANIKATMCLLRFKAAGVPLVVGFVGAVVLRCVHLVSKGRMAVGTFVSIFMMATASVGTLSWLVSMIKDATLDVGTLEHAQVMFWGGGASSKVPVVKTRPRALGGRPSSPPTVEMRHVSFAHKPKQQQKQQHSKSEVLALSDVTLTFEAGTVTALDGPIGCGKSTVLRLLSALTRPTSGDVYLGGVPYSEIGLAGVRHLVGYMPQDAVLFDRTAGENMIYGAPPGTTEAVAERVARELGLWDALSPGLPQGTSTQVGKGGSRLSGGQRQLIWFIRLAIRDPPVLVLDEPTASMDADTRDALIGAIARTMQQKTIVMATHDPGLAKFAERILELPTPSSSAHPSTATAAAAASILSERGVGY